MVYISTLLRAFMRVAFYNQMFGLHGKNPISHIVGHWVMHFQADYNKIFRRTNLNKTLDAVKKSKADIIGLCEVIQGQENEISNGLIEMGYKYIFFGKGYRAKKNKLIVNVVLASKVYCKNIEADEFPIINKIGGGGFLHVYFPRQKINLITLHLANHKKPRLKRKQLNFLKERVEKIKGKIIIIGDFNLRYKRLKKHFSDFLVASEGMKTCLNTSFYKLFYYKDLDHIFIKGFRCSNAGAIEGSSDHKLIFVDLD